MKDKQELKRIIEIMETIEKERENLTNNRFDEGFDCGTQLALDLLDEWKEKLEEGETDEE